MILDHMISASLLTSFFPLSIFCYALLEYPRPSKYYWKFVLYYTVFLLVIKFVIHIEVLRNDESFKEIMTKIYNYKIGMKLHESSFSHEFFMDIFYDALILIFLLINDYLLVSRGVWSKREQEIESIYQANERIIKKNIIKNKEGKDNSNTKSQKELNKKDLEQRKSKSDVLRRHNRFKTDLIIL